jgi:hypothetical protein
MRPKLTVALVLAPWLSTVTLLAAGPTNPPAAPTRLKLEALLIWGTNDHHSPDPTHKPADPDLLKKLHELPLKWTNYFVVNRKVLEVPLKGATKAALSNKYEVEVKHLGGAKLEVSSFGKGKPVGKRTQPLPKSETLILGGNDKGGTTWLVMLKRIE